MSWALLPLTHTCGGPDATVRFPACDWTAFEESDRRLRVTCGSLTAAFGASLAKRIGAGAHSGELPRKLPLHYPLRCRPKECF